MERRTAPAGFPQQIETHMDSLTDFIDQLSAEATAAVPILLASCMKHNYSDFAVLGELVHSDTMQNLKYAGYRRRGLDALCEELKIDRRGHSSLDDAEILQTVCTMKSEEMLQNPYEYTFIDIISYLNAKLPIPLQRVYGLANRCPSHADL